MSSLILPKKFDPSDLLADFLGKGGYHFNAEEVLKDFDYQSFLPRNRAYAEPEHLNSAMRLDEFSLDQINQLRRLQHAISEKYLAHLRHHIFYHDFYDIVYPTSQNWHYDIEDVLDFRGYNANLNCYFEDCFEERGDTGVTFAPFDKDLEGSRRDIGSEMVYVKKFDIVLINQTRRFLHRVTSDQQRRPILMFCISFMDLFADLPLPKRK